MRNSFAPIRFLLCCTSARAVTIFVGLAAFVWRRTPWLVPATGVAVLCLLVADGAAASPIDIVSPAGLENTEGNGDFVLPSFDVARQQQVYPAVDFAALPASHRWVAGFALRTDIVTDFAFTATTAHIEVRLSTTSVDSLDATFDNNTGPDEVLAYSGLFTAVDSGSGPPGGPHPFEYPLAFDTPFYYDPTAGNLLVELRYDGFEVNSLVDVYTDAEFYGDSAHRLIVGFANTTTADFLSDGIDVIQFRFVPEPAARVLAAWALVGLSAVGRRRRGTEDRRLPGQST